MKERGQKSLIYDLKDFLKKFFSSRLFVLFIVSFLLFGIILARVFSLQIINGAKYQEDFTKLTDKSITLHASRGNIYDCNGELLAYNKLAYSVTISDDSSYPTYKDKNKNLNAEIAKILQVLHKNNEEIYNNFAITLNEDGTYSYNISGATQKRFLADLFGKKKFEDLGQNKYLGFNNQTATAEQIMEYLMFDSKETYGISKEYDQQTAYEIVVIRYGISSNRFSKYMTTTIAQDVSDETVAYVNEHSDELEGIEIEEDTIRKYNSSEYFASIIGYTGTISSDEYLEYSVKDSSYTENDTVGKAGLEKTYESQLRGKDGKKNITVNNVGKITSETSSVAPIAGNDLYLSIDSKLQINTYDLLEQEIAGILYNNIKQGEVPINDVYFALINNNVIDLTHFSEDDASSTEKAVYNSFKGAQKDALTKVKKMLTQDETFYNDMSEESQDFIEYIIQMVKDDGILVSEKIDSNDEVQVRWRSGTVSPKEYFNYCISSQWMDISKLDVDEKYSDTSEIYNVFCSYILDKVSEDKSFSKIVYKYMIASGDISGKQICLIMIDQGVIDFDGKTVRDLKSGVKSSYTFLLEQIDDLKITPAQLALDPCSGSCIITDVNTGEIKALVSYPGYDNNKLANGVDAEYYNSLLEDQSKPLYNYATQERTAPGSTFKMITSIAGLSEGVLSSVNEEIKCTGIFKEVDNHPKCWKYPSNHGKVNVSEAIRDSCNIFYYTLGYRLSKKDTGTYDDASGISYIQKYAKMFGLDETTGLDREIEESTPHLATQFPVVAAIGQSDNNLTTSSLSRYVTAIASGKLYEYQLMKKIVDTKGKVVDSYKPTSESLEDIVGQTQWDAIHQGMRMVCEELSNFDDCEIEVAGKTGTAQQTNRPNHALYVGYAPYDDPDISIAVRIAHGYSSHNAAEAAKNIISCYYNKKDVEDVLDEKASGVNSSSNNSVND